MRSTTFLPVLLTLGLSINAQSTNSTGTNTTACVPANAVHMIVARASTEKPGQGIIGAVATQVQQTLPGSDSEAVEYPATLTDYFNSEASGVTAMTKLVENYSERCPQSKIALLGYSQGAQVAADVMCGRTEALFNSTQPLPAIASKNVVAMVLMGDPTHVPNVSFDVGNSTRAGIFPRLAANATSSLNSTSSSSANSTSTSVGGCSSAVAAMTKSFCSADDRFCDNGTSIQVHLSYVNVFGSQAAEWVVGMVNGTARR